jgi:hypothetical protein
MGVVNLSMFSPSKNRELKEISIGGDPEYEFFVVDCGYEEHNFVVGEARNIRILNRGLTYAFVRYFGRENEASYILLPASMVKPKLRIDPFFEEKRG